MTVRIAQDLGVKKIVNFSKKLGIYENPSELLSISLGSAETTLLKLTSAYSSFVNGGKLVKPIMIDRIQDSEGVTIFNNEMRDCINCDQISHLSDNYPKIEDKFEQIFSPQTAYQMTSILEGTVQNGTGKNLKKIIFYFWKIFIKKRYLFTINTFSFFIIKNCIPFTVLNSINHYWFY